MTSLHFSQPLSLDQVLDFLQSEGYEHTVMRYALMTVVVEHKLYEGEWIRRVYEFDRQGKGLYKIVSVEA